ncbi:hypothetical protein EDC96DRAFT_445201, partial [Choanephora cucurbitarum]
LPPLKGGVGIIDPIKQYLVLQMKWLFQLFSPEFSSCKQHLLHHLSIMQVVSDKPLLPFFVPEFQHHPLCHPNSIIQTMYKTIDHFGIRFECEELPLSTLPPCPLQYLFEDLSATYWLYRYKTIPVSSFLNARSNPGGLTVRISTNLSCLNPLYSLDCIAMCSSTRSSSSDHLCYRTWTGTYYPLALHLWRTSFTSTRLEPFLLSDLSPVEI